MHKGLESGLLELGLDGNQHVIVHASLKSFGYLDGGVKRLLGALEVFTGTLVMPSFSYSSLLYGPNSRPRNDFYRYSKVSRDIGALSQALVDRPDALRSFHPALSFVAIGEYASGVVKSQSLHNPYLPVGALYDLDGYILLIGVDFSSNTSIHYGEYLAGVPLLTEYVTVNNKVKPTAYPNCSGGFDYLASKIYPASSAVVGNSFLRLYRIRDTVESTVKLLKAEPESLLCKIRSCRCQQVRKMMHLSGGIFERRVHEGMCL